MTALVDIIFLWDNEVKGIECKIIVQCTSYSDCQIGASTNSESMQGVHLVPGENVGLLERTYEVEALSIKTK